MMYSGTYQTVQVRKRIGVLTISYAAVIAAELAYVDILCVKVEGQTYNIKQTGSPENKFALYASNIGWLLFPVELGGAKKVFVMYQR